MDREQVLNTFMIPLLAVLAVAVYAGGLGVVFMLLDRTPLHEWAVIVVGVALLVGVPSVAALLEKVSDKT